MRVAFRFLVLLVALSLVECFSGPARAHEKLAALLKETLNEEQLKQLRQLVLQQEGLFALGHPEVMAELKVTDEQQKQYEGKIEGILSDAQKKQWKQMLGEPFDPGD